MRYISGSHRWNDQLHEESNEPQNRLSRGQRIAGIDEDDAVDVILRPAESAFHHERTVHGSKGNTSAKRRQGFSAFYIPTHVRSTAGRRGALLVRGVDEYGHWDADPVPEADLDETGLAASRKASAQYFATHQRPGQE